jgi:hypothetical protein
VQKPQIAKYFHLFSSTIQLNGSLLNSETDAHSKC